MKELDPQTRQITIFRKGLAHTPTCIQVGSGLSKQTISSENTDSGEFWFKFAEKHMSDLCVISTGPGFIRNFRLESPYSD